MASSAIVFTGLFELALVPHERIKDIQTLKQDFDDIRKVETEECKYKRLSLIRKSQFYRKEVFDFSECDLSSLYINELAIKNCNLKHINFTQSRLFHCRFENCDLTAVSFAKGRLHFCVFKNCRIDEANYFDCGIFEAGFEGSNLITFDQTNHLNSARYIFGSKNLNPILLGKIQAEKPALLERPDARKMSNF